MILWFGMSKVDLKSVKKSGILYIILVITVLYGIIYLKELRREKLLEESNTIIATVTNKSSGYKGSNSLYVEYKIKGKIYRPYGVQLNSCTEKFKVGDTVLIRFSLKDPKVVSIVDCEEGAENKNKKYG